MNLELIAMRWMRYERKLPVVMRERSPRMWLCGEPDVIGITPSRYLVEIEIKRSVSDFRADFKKRSRINREAYIHLAPKQFYYLVLPDMVDRVEPIVPAWAGLMTTHSNEMSVVLVKTAPVNRASKRLTINESARLVHMMANHLLTVEERCDKVMNNFRNGYDPLPWPHVIDYSI